MKGMLLCTSHNSTVRGVMASIYTVVCMYVNSDVDQTSSAINQTPPGGTVVTTHGDYHTQLEWESD